MLYNEKYPNSLKFHKVKYQLWFIGGALFTSAGNKFLSLTECVLPDIGQTWFKYFCSLNSFIQDTIQRRIWPTKCFLQGNNPFPSKTKNFPCQGMTMDLYISPVTNKIIESVFAQDCLMNIFTQVVDKGLALYFINKATDHMHLNHW